jgi:hypothetical protein
MRILENRKESFKSALCDGNKFLLVRVLSGGAKFMVKRG